MKKTILFFVIVCICEVSNAQIIKIKNGTNLVYEVGDNNYLFKVHFTEVSKTVSFKWEMTNKNMSKGSITISENALANCKMYFNYLRSGELNLDDASSVIMSNINFTELLQKKETQMSHLNNGSFVNWKLFENESQALHPEIMINGKPTPITLLVSGYKDEAGIDYLVATTSDCNLHLIVYMDLGFTIKLKAVEN
jgi:hypothetical protein